MIVMLVTIEPDIKKALITIHYIMILLRKVISYSCRNTSFDEVMLKKMKVDSQALFKAVIYLQNKLNLSFWVLCNVAPDHAAKTLYDYGLGLGCNSMEAREQKHQIIAKYAAKATVTGKWHMVFRHEFVHLIYLRENYRDIINYKDIEKKDIYS